uniref:waprin-Phi1-like n=1 Tax=Podarcis muralis TaxID=64176 RepID=UPI00109F7BB8|nr:waprin-Phi1-like [Podarcis muralis]
MTPRNSSCFHHLLLVSLVGLLTASAHLIDTPGQNVTVAAEKAGTCPNATLGTARGNCTEECQSDASCAGTEKCCWTGCGASCRLPNDKPGFCPPDPLSYHCWASAGISAERTPIVPATGSAA